MLMAGKSHATGGVTILLAGLITACALVDMQAVAAPLQPNVQIETLTVYPDPHQMPLLQRFTIRLLLINRTPAASEVYLVMVSVGDNTGQRQFPVCLRKQYPGLAPGERNPVQFDCEGLPSAGDYHLDVLVVDRSNRRMDGARMALSVPVFSLTDVSIRPAKSRGEYQLTATVGNNTPELADHLDVTCQWTCPAGTIGGGYAILVSGGNIRSGGRFTYSTPFRMQCDIQPRDLVLSCAMSSGKFRRTWQGSVASGR